jgi:hypothetical protein
MRSPARCIAVSLRISRPISRAPPRFGHARACQQTEPATLEAFCQRAFCISTNILHDDTIIRGGKVAKMLGVSGQTWRRSRKLALGPTVIQANLQPKDVGRLVQPEVWDQQVRLDTNEGLRQMAVRLLQNPFESD